MSKYEGWSGSGVMSAVYAPDSSDAEPGPAMFACLSTESGCMQKLGAMANDMCVQEGGRSPGSYSGLLCSAVAKCSPPYA